MPEGRAPRARLPGRRPMRARGGACLRPGHGVLLRGARLRARSPDGGPAAATPRPAGAGQVPLPRAGDRRGRPAERRLGSPAPAASRPQRRGGAARGAGRRRAGSEGASMPGVPAGIRGGGDDQADALPAPLPRRLPPPLARKDQLLPALPPRAAHRGPGVRGVQAGEGPQGAASAPAGVSAWRHVHVSPVRGTDGPRCKGGAQKPHPFSVLFLSKNSTQQSSEGFLTNKNSPRLYFQGWGPFGLVGTERRGIPLPKWAGGKKRAFSGFLLPFPTSSPYLPPSPMNSPNWLQARNSAAASP